MYDELAISQWRHTISGWERLVPAPSTQMTRDSDLPTCHLHPVVLSLLEGMLSVLVLVAFSPCGKASEVSEQTIPDQSRKIAVNLGEIELRSRAWMCNPSNL